MSEVIALLVSDLHLSYNPPTARSAEPDWLVAQGRVLDQLRGLIDEHQAVCCCAGDVFDRHNSGPALINWAIDCLPRMYAVPGQHDLPHHNLDDIGKSAYWTLVMAGRIETIPVDLPVAVPDMNGQHLVVHGFPWGSTIVPPMRGNKERLHMALAHRYLWVANMGYDGAASDTHVSKLKGGLEGYDVAVFGDNHKPFDAGVDGCLVHNCGCLIPRTMDERHHKPSVGLLKDDATVERVNLDASEDRWLDEIPVQGATGQSVGLDEFLTGLRGLDSTSLDFCKAVGRYISDNDVGEDVRRVLVEILEKGE